MNYESTKQRMDVGAQKALLKLKRDPATHAVAMAMITAVKSGRLNGIYGDDLPTVARLAGRRGIDSWELVPRGQVAVVYRESNRTAAPTVIYRAHYRNDPIRLATALARAWRCLSPSSYGPETEADYRTRPSTSGEFDIIGTDDRILVSDTLEIPFRFICCLEFEFKNPVTGDAHPWRGSGTLISDKHVLTVAHNLLRDPSTDPKLAPFPIGYIRPSEMLVAPARNDRKIPGNFSRIKTTRVSSQWQATADRQKAQGNASHLQAATQFDFGLLTLEEPLGAKEPNPVTLQLPPPPLGFWGHQKFGGGTRIRAYDNNELPRLRNATVNLSGYPADKCRSGPSVGSATEDELDECQHHPVPNLEFLVDWGSTQWRSSGQIVNPAPAPGVITYNLDSFGGHSGGPVWLRWQEHRNLVAIHVSGFNTTANRGVRITPSLLNQLRVWMKADGVNATF